jgi:hypothetical protein
LRQSTKKKEAVMESYSLIGTPPPPGPVVCVQPYILTMTPNFSGVVGEGATVFTQSTGFPLRVLALQSTLSTALVQLRGARDELWNEEAAPIQIFAGRNEKVEIYRKLYAPYTLQARETLRADFSNPTGLDTGSLYFWCERVLETPPSFKLEYPKPFTLSVTATPDALVQRTRTINQRFLIFGAMHDTGLNSSVVTISDSYTNQQWADTALPVQVFSGFQGNIRPVLWFPRPFVLEPNANLKLEFDTVSGTVGKFTFVGQLAE